LEAAVSDPEDLTPFLEFYSAACHPGNRALVSIGIPYAKEKEGASEPAADLSA